MKRRMLCPNFSLYEDFGRKWFWCRAEGKDPRGKKSSEGVDPLGRKKATSSGACRGRRSKKPPPVPLSALLRTRIDQGVPQGRFLDPTTWVGLQAPTSLLAPSGYSIGSSKGSPVHEHRRGLWGRHRPHTGNVPCPRARCKRLDDEPFAAWSVTVEACKMAERGRLVRCRRPGASLTWGQ